MNSKIINITVLMIFIFISILTFNATREFPDPIDKNTINSGYYPALLAVLLMIFSIIGIFQSIYSKQSKLTINNFIAISLSILLIIIYFLFWYFIGYFYILTFIFLILIINYYDFYQTKKMSIKNFLKNTFISLIAICVIYLIFDIILSMSF